MTVSSLLSELVALDVKLDVRVGQTRLRLRLGRHSPEAFAAELSIHDDLGQLLDPLWFQFALAVARDAQYKACDHCGGPFEIATTRTDRIYCSQRCKVQAHRKRERPQRSKAATKAKARR